MTPTTEHISFIGRIQHFTRLVRLIMIITGILALGYVAVTLISARIYQHYSYLALNKHTLSEEQHKLKQPVPPIKEGDVLGRIEIPRIGVSVAVLQGTTWRTLRLGVGHIKGTALPGEAGNIGIAGHRDTYFRALKDIHMNDEIQLQSATGTTKYVVDWIHITSPREVEVLAPSTKSTLTFVTCYPFYYIGSAPERYIVRAHKQ